MVVEVTRVKWTDQSQMELSKLLKTENNVTGISYFTLIYPPIFTPVGYHRAGVKLPPGVYPFLGHVRKILQRFAGKTFLRCKLLCSGSHPVPEVDIAEAETGNCNICGCTQKSYIRNSDVCLHFLSTSCSMATKSKRYVNVVYRKYKYGGCQTGSHCIGGLAWAYLRSGEEHTGQLNWWSVH